MQRRIFLHGNLAKSYGYDVKVITAETTQQAFQGLFCLLGAAFKQLVRAGTFRIYRGKPRERNDLAKEELGFNLGSTTELHVYPVPTGRGRFGQTILGVLLIVGGVIYGIYTGDIKTAAQVVIAGVAVLASGIMASMAAKPLSNNAAQQAGLNPSFIFNGTVNVTEQGGPVPIILGRAPRASSIVLSAGLSNKSMV